MSLPRFAATAVRSSIAIQRSVLGRVAISPLSTPPGLNISSRRFVAAMSATPPSAAAAAPTCPEQQKAATTVTPPDESSSPPADPELPPLTPAQFRQFNQMADHMEMFHSHFRSTWNMLWNACTSGRRPAGMSLKSFINEGLQFIQHLTVHHNIEEQHIFPVLARKMPEFKAGKGNGAAELLRQHREIHKGMDKMEEYLRDVQAGREEFDLSRLKEKMESWGTVLWTHLDQEVKTLGAENMRKYWTVEEIRRMPM